MFCFELLFLNHRFEELTNLIKTIRNAMKIRDMAKCLEEFEQLCRAFLKSKNIVDKEGVPPFYIRLLADLEDYLNQVSSPELNHCSQDADSLILLYVLSPATNDVYLLWLMLSEILNVSDPSCLD